MVLSHCRLAGIANQLRWEKSAVQEIVHFGKWIFVSSILSFLVSNGDRLLLGGMIDKTTFGVYVIAFMIFSAVELVLLKIIGSISLPALSEIVRERPSALRAAYYRIHMIVAACAYFISGTLIMLGQTLIGKLYDARYAQAGWMLEFCRKVALRLRSK